MVLNGTAEVIVKKRRRTHSKISCLRSRAFKRLGIQIKNPGKNKRKTPPNIIEDRHRDLPKTSTSAAVVTPQHVKFNNERYKVGSRIMSIQWKKPLSTPNSGVNCGITQDLLKFVFGCFSPTKSHLVRLTEENYVHFLKTGFVRQ